MSEHMKDTLDVVALGGIIGSLTDFLPAVAAFFGLIWTLIRIYEWARYRIFRIPSENTYK